MNNNYSVQEYQDCDNWINEAILNEFNSNNDLYIITTLDANVNSLTLQENNVENINLNGVNKATDVNNNNKINDVNCINVNNNNNEENNMTWDESLTKTNSGNIVVLDEEHSHHIIDLLKLNIPTDSTGDVIIIEDNCNNIELKNIKCTNCDQLFTEKDFENHICEYDENKNLIDNDTIVLKIEDPPCIKQLKENNLRIRRFLKDELKIDMKQVKKNDGPHECNMCERKFVHASGLSRHMEKHAMDVMPITGQQNSDVKQMYKVCIKCTICGRLFSNTDDALQHVIESHEDDAEFDDLDLSDYEDEEYYNDNIFSLGKFLTPKNIGVHTMHNAKNNLNNTCITNAEEILKAVILNGILQCEFCDYLFADVYSLLSHEISHDPIRGFECKSCCINVLTLKEIIIHWQAECPYTKEATKKNINLKKYYICNVCENRFPSLDQLYEHRYVSIHLFPRVNTTNGSLQIGCENCGPIFFDDAKTLLIHYDERHVKKFKREALITKYRQYLCDVCGKSYTQSSHLWQHLRFHRGVKPFACKETGCNRRFTIRPDLNDHIRKCHTGERPYHCLVCGKRFLTGSVFYQHRLIHRGERRYGCNDCGKRFYRADALKNHQRIHTGEKPYACTYCPKNFRQRGDRDKHIRARHTMLANGDANNKKIKDTDNNNNGNANINKNGNNNKKNISKCMNGSGINKPTTGGGHNHIKEKKTEKNKMNVKNINKNNSNNNNIVYVGNVAFPTSMFKPIIKDIDDENQQNEYFIQN